MKTLRLAIFIIVGLVVSFGACSLMISVGYAFAYQTIAENYTVTFVGLPIYELTRAGNVLNGEANSGNMAIIGVMFALIVAVAGEAIWGAISKRRRSQREAAVSNHDSVVY